MKFTKNLSQITYLLLALVTLSLRAQPAQTNIANGYPELWDRPYNQVMFINGHNSTSIMDAQHLFNPVADQDMSVADQLKAGLRAMKVPVHWDYGNYVSHFVTLLEKYGLDIQGRIDERTQTVNQQFKAATQKVQDWQKSLGSIRDVMNAKERWFNNLSTGDKIIKGIQYGQDMAALKVDEAAAKAALAAAQEVMRTAQQAYNSFKQLDPITAQLTAELSLVEGAALLLKQNIPASDGRAPYACHGLTKRQVYDEPDDFLSRYIDDLKQNPQLNQIIVKIAESLKKFLRNKLELLFGPRDQWWQTTGLIPYPSCLIDRTKTRYSEFLRTIKNFLDQNTHDVFTLFVEDWVKDNKSLAKDFQDSGLAQYAYTITGNTWPTLGQMISSGKRLMIFTTSDFDSNYPWLNPQSTYFGTFTETLKPEELKKIVEKGQPFPALPAPGPQVPQNKLITIGHSTTPGLAGSKADARFMNRTDVVLYEAKRIATLTNHIPNFIGVDFFEVPNMDVIDAQNQLNGVGKYKTRPDWILNILKK